MSIKDDLDQAAYATAAALLGEKEWAPAASQIQSALWLARRAAEGQFIDGRDTPQDGTARGRYHRQSGALTPTYGWEGLMALAYGLAEELLEEPGSPFAAWEWTDVKTKFGTLRMSGWPMAPERAALRRACKAAGIPSWIAPGEAPTPGQIEAASQKLREMGLRGPAIFNGQMALSDEDCQAAAELAEKFDPMPGALIQEIAELAESATERLCEGCGRPGQTSGGGWISNSCGQCFASKERSSPPAMPAALLAMEALRACIWQTHRNGTSPGDLAAALRLAPIAKLAMHGLDPAASLPHGPGPGLVDYVRTLPELVWFEQAGVDPLSPARPESKTPMQMLAEFDPEQASAAEAWLIARDAEKPLAAANPRKTL